MTVKESIEEAKRVVERLEQEDQFKTYIMDYTKQYNASIVSKYSIDPKITDLVFKMICKELNLEDLLVHTKKDVSKTIPSEMTTKLVKEIANYYLKYGLRKTAIKYNITSGRIYRILNYAGCTYRRNRKSSNG